MNPVSRPELRAVDAPEGMLAVIRRVGGKLVSRRSEDGHVERVAVPTAQITRAPVDKFSQTLEAARSQVPSAEQLLERLDTLYPRPLTLAQEQALRELNPDARRQTMATLTLLRELKTKRLTAAQYMLRVLRSAAEISGADGPLFIRLAQLSLAAQPARKATASELLDRVFHALRQDLPKGRYGFDANLQDVSASPGVQRRIAMALDPHTGPWGRLVALSGSRGTPEDNRCELFGRMLGRGLSRGALTPARAVELVRWAFTPSRLEESAPPWGFGPKDFQLDAWLECFGRRKV